MVVVVFGAFSAGGAAKEKESDLFLEIFCGTYSKMGDSDLYLSSGSSGSASADGEFLISNTGDSETEFWGFRDLLITSFIVTFGVFIEGSWSISSLFG